MAGKTLKKRSGPKIKKRASAPTLTERKLTAKESAFVRFYVATNNASQSALKAGYSEKTAARIGQQNLQKLVIQQKIEQERQKAYEKEDLTPEKVIKQLKTIAFTNPIDFYENWFQEKDMDSVRHLGPAISEISTKIDPKTGERLFRLKFQDKLKAIEMLKEFMPKTQENDDVSINFSM